MKLCSCRHNNYYKGNSLTNYKNDSILMYKVMIRVTSYYNTIN